MGGTDQKVGLAVLCALSSMALFGLIDNFMRLAAEAGSLWQFHMIRSAIALIVLVVIVLLMGLALRPKRTGWVIGRTAFSVSAMLIYFGCLGYMPIAQAVAGLFLAPLFVVVFSVVLFGERVGFRRVCAVILGFTGIMLVLRPDTQGFGPLTVLPVIAGACHALGNITTRRWCAEEGTQTLLAAFFVVMFTAGALGLVLVGIFVTDPPAGADGFVFRGWTPFTGDFMVITIVQGFGSLIGLGLIIRAYQFAEASFVGVFENAMIVFATLWALVLWGEVPDATGLFGLLLVLVSGLIISVRTRDAGQVIS